MDVSFDPLFPLFEFNRDVARPALVAIRPAHRRGTNALLPRTFVDVRRLDEQVVDVNSPLGFMTGVGDGGTHNLFNFARRPLIPVSYTHLTLPTSDLV